MIVWSVELSKFDIQFEPRGLVKAQALVEFQADFRIDDAEPWWNLYIDGVSGVNGSGVGIILEGPNSITLNLALKPPITKPNTRHS